MPPRLRSSLAHGHGAPPRPVTSPFRSLHGPSSSSPSLRDRDHRLSPTRLCVWYAPRWRARHEYRHLTLPRPPAQLPPTESFLAQQALSREAIERAAYLCLPPAPYKCGFLFEHADLGCVYDPLMSVQWLSLASQGGEEEADIALSKWSLCGAEGHFSKIQELARAFAEKAARKGHPNGWFCHGILL